MSEVTIVNEPDPSTIAPRPQVIGEINLGDGGQIRISTTPARGWFDVRYYYRAAPNTLAWTSRAFHLQTRELEALAEQLPKVVKLIERAGL